MKIYEPIADLGMKKRRQRRNRFTFGLVGVMVLGLLLYWVFTVYRGNSAQARTDRIISLSSPDFTEILADGMPIEESEQVSLREGARTGGWASFERPGLARGMIEPDQTLFVAMRDLGIDPGSIQSVVDSFDGTLDFRRCRPGDRWETSVDDQAQIVTFRYTVSPEEVYEATRQTDGSYQSVRLHIPTEITMVGLGGVVHSSLYQAMEESGEGSVLASRFMLIFGWDIDFSKEVRPGDTFRVVVEKVYINGEFLRYGRVLAAEYHGRAAQLQAFAFSDDQGQTEYYSADGQALRRTFLRSPLHYNRISSRFSWRRFHPVLHRYRPHLGVDYAAPSGTPVWAIADGRVTFAGARGGNGNLIVIHHDDGYESIYAHLLRFGTGIQRGRAVRQGEVIGYVGNTGVSTGPHLHFGMRHNGEYLDPLGVDARRAPSLEGQQLQRFQQEVAQWTRELDALVIGPVDPSLIAVEDETEEEEILDGDFGLVEGFIDDDMTEIEPE